MCRLSHAYLVYSTPPEHMAGKEPRVLDADELVEEIVARKGPHNYTQGLSEDNWEEVN